MFLWGTWVSLGRQKFFPLTRVHCLSGYLGDFWSLELLPEQPCSVHNTLFQWLFFSEQASIAQVDTDFGVLFCQRNIKPDSFLKLGKIHAVAWPNSPVSKRCCNWSSVIDFFMYYPTNFPSFAKIFNEGIKDKISFTKHWISNN